jgi:hypothetical protein
MKTKNTISILVISILVLSGIAASTGIFTNSGPGSYEYQSIRGKSVQIYGKGVYNQMSADVAVQGIAQDYITLFLGIPLLLVSLLFFRKGSLKGRFILAGTLNYFFVTYLFYLEIAMYNPLFLVYVGLISASFFALVLVLLSFDLESLPLNFKKTTPTKFIGGFLIFNSICVAMLWLGVVVPPLMNGTIIPDAVAHYTTLTVQGLDLALFLPIGFISGLLLIKKDKFGYLFATVTAVFLTILMTALVAKIIGMASTGVNVIPVVFIIPSIAVVSLICTLLLINSLQDNYSNS